MIHIFDDEAVGVFQEYVKEANRRRTINEKFLAQFPKEAAAIFAGENNGKVSVAPPGALGHSTESMSPAAKKLIALFPDKKKLALAVANGLGELCLLDSGEGSWSMSTSREQLALECVKTLNAEEFEAILQSDNDTILLGAARLFFFEKLFELVPADKRAPQAARLCEVVFRLDQSDNADSALRALGHFPSAETTALLERLTSAEIAVKSPKTTYKREPALQPAACLLLARAGSPKAGELIKKVEATPNLDEMDKAALLVARSFNGERGVLDKSIFKINSFTVDLGALAALEKEGGQSALDAIIDGGTNHQWAAVRQESVLTVERMIGQKWRKGLEGERPDWYCKDIQAWWKKNRDSFQMPTSKSE